MNHRSQPSLGDIPIFAQTPRGELKTFASLSTVANVEAGQMLMLEGAFAREVIVLLEGELIVERDNEVLAVLAPGAVVGEQAMLLEEPRNATVSASKDSIVVAMARPEFASVLERCPRIAKQFLRTALQRNASTLA